MDSNLKVLCEICIAVTNKLLLQSYTRDVVTHMPPSNQYHHLIAIGRMREKTFNTELFNKIDSSLKFSIGNCGEFARLCCFLIQSLLSSEELNSKNIAIFEGKISPGDHVFCLVREDVSPYIVDPWSKVILPLNAYEAFVRGHTPNRFFKRNSRVVYHTPWTTQMSDSCLTLYTKYNLEEAFRREINERESGLRQIRQKINIIEHESSFM